MVQNTSGSSANLFIQRASTKLLMSWSLKACSECLFLQYV